MNGSMVGGATVSTKPGSSPDPGGQLGGNGLIDPANGSTVENGGTITPGDPLVNGGIGTLTIGSVGSENNVVALGGSTFQFQLGLGADKLVIFGGLDLAGPGISLILSNAGGIASGLYTLIDYSTALTGSFSNLVLSAPGGVQATLINNTANGSIDVQIGTIPEPGATALFGLGAVLAWALLGRQSRRLTPAEITLRCRRSSAP